MRLVISNLEVACFCSLFNQVVPQIVIENFGYVATKGSKRDMEAFVEKFKSMGIILMDGNELALNDEIQNLFMNIFVADVCVSLLDSDSTLQTMYYSKFGLSSIKTEGDMYVFETIQSQQESLDTLGKALGLEEKYLAEGSFEHIIPADEFEILLSEENTDYPEDITKKIKEIVTLIQYEDGPIVITERILKKGTIVTQFGSSNGIVYQSMIYTEKGDFVVVGNSSRSDAMKTILNFRGR